MFLVTSRPCRFDSVRADSGDTAITPERQPKYEGAVSDLEVILLMRMAAPKQSAGQK